MQPPVLASGIILAGGDSSRMGLDKSLLPWKNGTVIGYIVQELRRIAPEIIIVSNHSGKYTFPGSKEISDEFINMGPLGGIHAGLKAASHDYVFVTACDLPFFDKRLALYLLEQLWGFQAAVPQQGALSEPLFAAYDKSCLPVFESCLQQGISKVQEAYSQLRINYVSEEKLKRIADSDTVFFNLNTPRDYALLQKNLENLACAKPLWRRGKP
ncbi:MAG: molybdenum cofactor guanylyltransferase [Clostridia bacterium]|nr:molybdenum cofactor guanylyltransferase [Clostridia bacterium]